MTIDQAKAAYVHRYTMEYVPEWAKQQAPNGRYYAPQYRTDAEWFANTLFPPNNPVARSKRDTSCFSTNQSWPLGHWLDAPFQKGRAA